MKSAGRVWSWLAVAMGMAAMATVAVAGPDSVASAAVSTSGPASVPAGTGCHAGMRVWVPSAAALASGDPRALAPGLLSPRAQTAFGTEVLRLLRGHHIRWLGTTGCRQVPDRAAPRPAHHVSSAAPASLIRNAVRPAAASQPNTSANWSGYEVDLANFTGASMTWVVPAPETSTAPAAMSIWPGIGQGDSSSDNLIQAGTQQSTAGGDAAWTEVVPGEDQQQISGFPVSTGDNMAVNVGWDSATGTAAFLVANYTAGVAKEVTSPVTGSSGSSAEWIVERTASCANSSCSYGIYPHLLKFSSVKVGSGAAEQTTGGITTGQYIGGFSGNFQDDMQDCGQDLDMATPSSVNTLGDFTDKWEHAGPVDPIQCLWSISPSNAAFTAENATDTTAELSDTTGGLALTCQLATLSGMTADSPEAVTYPTPLATVTSGKFGGCADQHSNAWSAAQAAGSTWSFGADTPSTDGVTAGEIDGLSAQVAGTVSTKACTFTITGAAKAGDASFANQTDLLSITALPVSISGVAGAGCATAKVHDGDTGTLSAIYRPSAEISVNPGPG